MVLAVAVVSGVLAVPAAAAPATSISPLAQSLQVAAAGDLDLDDLDIPETPHEPWDGEAGVDPIFDSRLRGLVADIAELHEDVEVRDAAAKALSESDAAITAFFNSGQRVAVAAATARKAAKAKADKAAVQALAGTGGPIFNAEVTRFWPVRMRIGSRSWSTARTSPGPGTRRP